MNRVTNPKKEDTMKMTKIWKMAFAASLLVVFTACNQEEDDPAYTPTENDAAKVMEESLAKSSGGMTDEIAKLNESIFAKDIGNLNLQCGIPFDTTLTYILSGDATGSWTRNWNLLLNCPNDANPFLDVNTTYEGSFSGSFQSRDREGNRSWTWSELGPEGEFIFLNGTGAHSGARTFNGPNQATFSWSQSAEWTDVAISKATHIIDSGSGTFSLTFTGPQGNTYNFDGTVVFNGDQTATVTINGEVYEVELG
jgi:hypothetical protein